MGPKMRSRHKPPMRNPKTKQTASKVHILSGKKSFLHGIKRGVHNCFCTWITMYKQKLSDPMRSQKNATKIFQQDISGLHQISNYAILIFLIQYLISVDIVLSKLVILFL